MTQTSSSQVAAPVGRIARLSLEHKVPLVIGALLLTVIVALATASYLEVRRTAVSQASDRLMSVTTQFRDLFQQSAATLRSQSAALAAQPVLAEYAAGPSPSLRARALAAMQYTGPNADQVLGTQLRDSTGRILLSTVPASAGLDTLGTQDVLPMNEPGDSATIGMFRSLRDTIVYAIASPVSGARNAYVVRWRRVSASRRAREQTAQLIGSDASLFFGNPAGGRWTDLERMVPAPPLDLSSTEGIQEYRRGDGARHLAAVARVPNTPWVFAVAFPMEHVMAPVVRFVTRLTWIATLVLIGGLLLGWLLSRRLTAPLRQLTMASDAMAHGDYSQRVRIDRSDELGRLGHAFSAMADEVQHTRAFLEQKVEERTRDLNLTLEQLHDAQDALVRKEKLAMLGQLSSGIGHELRNPLAVMTNAVYYLKAVLEQAPPSVHEYLEIVQQQITLSEKIVSDLLDFARQKPPQRKPTSLVDITEAQLFRLGSTNGVRIETAITRDLPRVLADPVQVGQIVLNLLTNAVQAVGKAGEIRIQAEPNGDRVHYEVDDTGPGIPPENMDRIFEPLFTTKARGIGLGLAVSRTLARANNGDLTATNVPGRGARFRLTLEVAPT